MKSKCILILSLVYNLSFAQSKELTLAKDYYTSYVKESKIKDLEIANENIEKAVAIESVLGNDEKYFYLGVITKQLYESKKIEDRTNLVHKATDALIKSYNYNQKSVFKPQILKLLQILGYDFYEDGIKLFKANKHDEAYLAYKKLIVIQSILTENKMDFTVSTVGGQVTNLSNSDIMNNFAVFCMNSGKKDEAKLIFENEVKSSPSPANYSKLIQLCQQIGDTFSSNKYIVEGFKKYPNDEDLLIFTINNNLDKNKLNEALTLLDTAIKLAPNAKLFLVKAQIFDNKGEYENAVKVYREGLVKYSEDFDLNYNLATAVFNQGLRELNKKNNISHSKGMEYVKEARSLFVKAKTIDATKTDIDKILKTVDEIQ